MFVVFGFFSPRKWLVDTILPDFSMWHIKIKLKLGTEFFQGYTPAWLSKAYIYQETSTSAKIETWWETGAM